MADLGKVNASELEGKRLYFNTGHIRQVLHTVNSTMEKLIVEPGDLFIAEDVRELKSSDFTLARENNWCTPVSFTKLDGKVLAVTKGFKRVVGMLKKVPFDHKGTFVWKAPEEKAEKRTSQELSTRG